MTLTSLFDPASDPHPLHVRAHLHPRSAHLARFGPFLLGTADLGPAAAQADAQAVKQATETLNAMRALNPRTSLIKSYGGTPEESSEHTEQVARHFLDWQERHGPLFILHDPVIRREQVSILIGTRCPSCHHDGTLERYVSTSGVARIDPTGQTILTLPPTSHTHGDWRCSHCNARGTRLPVLINGRPVRITHALD